MFPHQHTAAFICTSRSPAVCFALIFIPSSKSLQQLQYLYVLWGTIGFQFRALAPCEMSPEKFNRKASTQTYSNEQPRPRSTPPLSPPTLLSSLRPLPLTLFLPLLELSPLFLPALPLRTPSLLCSCETSCVCELLAPVCWEEFYVCARRLVCFSKWRWSGAVHQWSWLQTGGDWDLCFLT